MTKPFSSDLFDRLVSVGLELIDTGYAELPGNMRSDLVSNVEHVARRQMTYIKILWSEERGFYISEKSALGIFSPYTEGKNGSHNEKEFNKALDEHIAFLGNARDNVVSTVSENIRRMEGEDVLPECVVLPTRFTCLYLGEQLFGVKLSYANLFCELGAVLSAPQFGRFFTFPLLV